MAFSEEDTGRVAIVATELGTNLLKHGGGGVFLAGHYDDETGLGVECLALDRGPGMASVEVSSRDGHSTTGSRGTGLGAVLRGASVSDIYSAPGHGTAVLARFAAERPKSSGRITRPSFGVVTVPYPGEQVCGDSWRYLAHGHGHAMMVADGLGHGPMAAEAALAAAKTFDRMAGREPGEMLTAMHAALRSTRGAAVSIMSVMEGEESLRFAGVGNVAGALVNADGGLRRLVSHNGTVGHVAKHMRGFTYPKADAKLMVMASDGLGTNWRLDAYPALTGCHPTLIAGVLYRDFKRGRDDVTVLVGRLSPT